MLNVLVHRLRRSALTALLCIGGLMACALLASAAQAATSSLDHNCPSGMEGVDCGTSHKGAAGGDEANVMIAEPAGTSGKVTFTEASASGQLVVFDAGGAPFEECTDTSTTTADCPLASGTGFSKVDGVGGNDTLRLRPGANGVRQLLGGPGTDTLYADDGNVQSQGIDCGDGAGDVVYLDANDPAPVGCETVNRVGSAGGGGGSGGGGSGGSGGTITDTAGPALVAPSAGRVIGASRNGGFGFQLGPFNEDTTGTVSIKSGAVAARASAKRRKRKRVVLNLGRKAFQAAAGKKATVKFKLSRKARKILVKRRRIKMSAAVTARDKAGNVTTKTYKFTLKAPRKKRRVR